MTLCRLFEYLQVNELNFPVIHHLKFLADIDRYLWIKEGDLGFLILVGRGLYILFGEIIHVNVLNMGSQNWPKITHLRLCVIMQRWPGYKGRKWSWGHASGRSGRWSDVGSPNPGLRFSENYFIQHASGLPDAEYKNSMLLYLLEKFQRLSNRGVKLIYFVWRIGHVQI